MAITNTRRSLIILRYSVPGQISTRASVGRYTRFFGRYWKFVTPLERRLGETHAGPRADHRECELAGELELFGAEEKRGTYKFLHGLHGLLGSVWH